MVNKFKYVTFISCGQQAVGLQQAVQNFDVSKCCVFVVILQLLWSFCLNCCKFTADFPVVAHLLHTACRTV